MAPMKFVEIVRPWSLDMRKMVRPERSGVLANLIVYALLWSWGYALVPHDFGDVFSLKCWLMPWECPKAEPVETRKELERRYHPILLGPGAGKKKACVCHADVHIFGKDIQHLKSLHEYSCDTEMYVPHNRWLQPNYWGVGNSITWVGFTVDGSFIEVHQGEGEFRWHCEGDEK
jgi:hypothetical protein